MTIQQLNKEFRKYFNLNAPIDMLFTMIKGPKNASLDLLKLDTILAQRDPEYNNEECTYKEEKDISMSKYIELKYGKEASEFINNNI